MRDGPVAAVVLAAGSGSRFGLTKQLASYRNRPLVTATAESVRSARVRDTLVVVGHDAHRVEGALLGLRVHVVHNARHGEGMATSLAAGIAALPADTEAAVIALGDQPVPPQVIDALIERWRRATEPIVAPRYRGTRGHPVLFDASVFAELRALEGDQGARELLDAQPHRVALVDFDIPAPRDVDTPADLEALGTDE